MKRKGITPLVGTALLVLIAISAVTSAAVFLRDTTSDIQENVNDKIAEDRMRENSGIDIEYAYENSDGNVSLVLRNTGQYTLAIEEDNSKKWNMYSNGTPTDFSYAGGPVSEKFIDAGESVTLNAFEDFPASGQYLNLRVEGPYGLESSAICDETVPDGQC
jgi:flagellin-like protein